MIAELIIDPDFRDLIPPLTSEERDQLKRNILVHGVISPLLVWKETGTLIDGHNRYQICRELNMEFPITELSFSDRDAVERFIIHNQLGRRNITPETATILRGKLYESLKKGQGGDRKSEESKSDNKTLILDTAAEVAKQTGVSRATVAMDAQLVRALKKLGESESDYMAGLVMDTKGRKRTKKSIIEEAFPPQAKKKAKKVVVAAVAPELPAGDEVEPLVVDGTKTTEAPKAASAVIRLPDDEQLIAYLGAELVRLNPVWESMDHDFILSQDRDQSELVKNMTFELWVLDPEVRTNFLTRLLTLEGAQL